MSAQPEQLHQHTRFEQTVWPQWATVLRTALFLTRHQAEAEDLAQETLLKALRNMQQFEDGTDVRAWLNTILRRTWIDRGRAAAHREMLSLDEMEFDPEDASTAESEWQEPEALLERFSDQQILDALHCLPEQIRWALLLVDVEGLDQQDAARVLEVPVGTIKSRLHRGRLMLRNALTPLARELRMLR